MANGFPRLSAATRERPPCSRHGQITRTHGVLGGRKLTPTQHDCVCVFVSAGRQTKKAPHHCNNHPPPHTRPSHTPRTRRTQVRTRRGGGVCWRGLRKPCTHSCSSGEDTAAGRRKERRRGAREVRAGSVTGEALGALPAASPRGGAVGITPSAALPAAPQGTVRFGAAGRARSCKLRA
jgi:hypothetical protein